MTTAKEAKNAIKARLVHESITIPIYWENESVELPDEPTAFGFGVFDNDGPGLGPASYGDGAFANRWRNTASVEIFVFVPQGTGTDAADDYAQAICNRLRSYRDSTISCFGAAVREHMGGERMIPRGLDSEVGNYWCAISVVDLHFDEVG
jgi:hypothetical protein